MIAERPDGTDRVAGGRRSLSSAGEARWRLRRRRPIEKRGEEGSERSGEISASLSARVAPGLRPALARNPSALSGATHHRAGRPPRAIYTRAAALSRLSIYPSSADESEGAGGASWQGRAASIYYLRLSMISRAVARLLNC